MNPFAYKPKDEREAEAQVDWMDAARKGGFYWSMMVGNWHQFKGDSALDGVCPCALATIGRVDPDHFGHSALRREAVRDVMEKTVARRVQRLGRWLMRRTRRV